MGADPAHFMGRGLPYPTIIAILSIPAIMQR